MVAHATISEEKMLISRAGNVLPPMASILFMRYVFQPIYDFHNNRIFGYEALMRPDTGENPEEFINRYSAENGGLHLIETTTMFNAINSFKYRNHKGKLFLNSFPCEFLTDDELIVLEKKFGKKVMSNLVIELLEYPEIDYEAWAKKRDTIKQYGGMIAIDDYGSGHNDNNCLMMFSPDLVKLDRGLITNIDKDPGKRYLLKQTIDYIRNQGIRVIAEGIETSEEFFCLKQMNVDFGQGYFFGKPA